MKACPLCQTSYSSHHTICPADGAPLVESRALEPGTIIRGKFRIVRKLGPGGMGTVYLAENFLLCRQCALNFISADLAQDPEFLLRFRREEQAAIELRHPNIVKVLEFDQADDGTPYIAMEYIAGPDLRHALLHASEEPDSEGGGSPRSEPAESAGALAPERAFPVPRALAIARGAAQGLAAAHAKGLLHRDVKPDNILLASAIGAPETPKLFDFGAAAMRETAAVLGGARGLMLSPQYAAPEQWRGIPSEDLDARTDLYALGGVLYEMLTGQTAFDARNAETWMFQHLHADPEPPSQLRPELANWQGLDSLVLRLLAKDRVQRPKDAAEVVALLDAVICVDPQVSRGVELERTRTGWNHEAAKRSRKPWVVIWGAGVALAIVALFAVPWMLRPKLQSASELQLSSKSERARPRHPSVAPAPPTLDSGGENQVSAVAQPGAIEKVVVVQASAPKPATTKPAIAEIEQRAEALDNQEQYSDAMTLFQQACTAGSGVACTNIGVMYEDGHGVEEDFLRAADFYSQGCTRGNADGCNLLGFMYETGVFGVAQDYSQAMELYSRACNAGNPNGCEGLGSMYTLGEGVPIDEQKAEMLDLQACNKGSVGSCISVADHQQASGNVSEARRLYQKACTMGEKYACNMADELPEAPQ